MFSPGNEEGAVTFELNASLHTWLYVVREIFNEIFISTFLTCLSLHILDSLKVQNTVKMLLNGIHTHCKYTLPPEFLDFKWLT